MRPHVLLVALFVTVIVAPHSTIGLLGPHGADIARQIEAEVGISKVLEVIARLKF